MNAPPPRQRDDATAIVEWICALDRDESGATLTEFIVVLPVFIIIFAGIMKISLLQSSTVQLKMAATEELWQRSIRVQRGVRSPGHHTDPFDGGRHSRGIVNRSRQERTFSDAADNSMALGAMRNGLTGRADAAMDTRFGRSSIAAEAQFQNLPPSTGQRPAPEVRQIVQRNPARFNYGTVQVTGRTWTQDLVDGTSTVRTPPQAPSPLNAMNISPLGNDAVPAYAAGIRYGIITSDERVNQSVIDSLPGYTSRDQLRAGYDTLAAPVSITTGPERFRPVGMSRRFMERYPGQLSNVLGVEMSSNYLP